jgi:hypothetical protein
MVVVVSVIVGDNVVASEVDGVRASDLEENTLVLSDGNIEGLLVVLVIVNEESHT